MRKIHVLKPHIANQIAAGEVVERPASVVKELIENSIDAGATSITVEIQNGGIDYIRIVDNGAGIPSEDCLLAFERHATSKITDSNDLTHIETLGFRGEALASIAAVAQVEMRSRHTESELGMLVRIEGGIKKIAQPISNAQGTMIKVENLFFNVPARRKFLKTPRSEAAYIADLILRIILMRPDISLRFLNNGKIIYQSTGDNQLKHAIYCVYGDALLPDLEALAYDDGYIKLYGYIGKPSAARPNRGHQSFFLNGRYIRSMQISNALSRAYDMQLMTKRYPFAVLNITLSSREVDVNVHPSKLEVRFAQENRIENAIIEACRNILHKVDIPNATLSHDALHTMPGAALDADMQAAHLTTIEKKTADFQNAMEIARSYILPKQEQEHTLSFDEPIIKKSTITLREGTYDIPHYRLDIPEIEPQTNKKEKNALSIEQTQKQGEKRSEQKEALPIQQTFGELPIEIIGSAYETYWFVQHGDALYIIDQHAAHERKLFETLMQANEMQASQTLLTPEILHFSYSEYEKLSTYFEDIRELGFELDSFGNDSLRIFSIPSVFTGANIQALMQDIFEMLKRTGAASTKAMRREAIIQSACKHAIKAGDAITQEEILDILTYFLENGTPLRCPHGRPIVIKITRRELDKMFKRII